MITNNNVTNTNETIREDLLNCRSSLINNNISNANVVNDRENYIVKIRSEKRKQKLSSLRNLTNIELVSNDHEILNDMYFKKDEDHSKEYQNKVTIDKIRNERINSIIHKA